MQVHPTRDAARAIDLKRLVDRLELRGLSAPILIRFPDILQHRIGEIHSAFQHAITQLQYQGRYVCVYPIKVNQQRQVVAGGDGLRPPVRLRPRGRLQARAAGGGGDGHQRHADHLQRLQGRRVHRDGDAGPEDRPQHHPGGREVHRARADPEVRREGRGPAADRHAGQAGGARHGPLAVVGRLPLEVRPDRHRDAARARAAARARHGGLLQAPPLPPRQPDHPHPHHQERPERGGPGLLRPGQGRRRGAVHRRRRRAGRRLRRLADQLRVEHELHPAGVRERRRVPHPAGVRRREGRPPDHRLGERPGDHRLPLGAGLQRARHQRVRRGDGADGAAGRLRAAAGRPDRHLSQRQRPQRRSRATTTRSRRSTSR